MYVNYYAHYMRMKLFPLRKMMYITVPVELPIKGKRGSRFFFPDDFESSPYPLRRYITQALT